MGRDQLIVVPHLAVQLGRTEAGFDARPPTEDELAAELARLGQLPEDDPGLSARIRAALALATRADIRAHLEVNPELALDLVDGLHIARPWCRSGRAWVRWDVRRMSVALVEPSGKLWWWECHVCKGRGRVSSETDALAVADQALIEAGWTLAGGRRG